MNFFVGYPRFDTDFNEFNPNPYGWLLPPSSDLPAAEGDEVFLIGWGRTADSARLVGQIIIGGFRSHIAAVEIVPKRFFGLLDAPLPEDLAATLPRGRELDLIGEERDKEKRANWLHPIDEDIGRELHRICQKHLPPTQSRSTAGRGQSRGASQQSPEEQIISIEKRAKGRVGQGPFRDALIEAYGGRCAISRCRIEAALSAAHIFDHSQGGGQEPWNGILLRADLHLLFDRHVLRIFPGIAPIVVLDEQLQQSKSYRRFHHRRLQLPNDFDGQQTNHVLRRRWDAANRVRTRFPDPPGANTGRG